MGELYDVLSLVLFVIICVLIIPYGFLWSMNVMFHTTYPYDFKHIIASLFILLLMFGITK